jgi:CheY-like chemotaxis protein
MPGSDKPLRGLSVLVVEDDEDNREVLTLALLQAGATVTSTGSAAEAFEMAKAVPPALVLTDIAMPHQGGIWLLQSMRAAPQLARVPVIAVTAYAMRNQREAIEAAGFDVYLVKPIDPDDLVAAIQDLTRRSI